MIKRTRWTEEQIKWISESADDVINLITSRYKQIKYLQTLAIFNGKTFEAIRVRLKRKLKERRAELNIMKEIPVEIESVEFSGNILYFKTTDARLIPTDFVRQDSMLIIFEDIDRLVRQRTKHRETVKNNRKGIRVR